MKGKRVLESKITKALKPFGLKAVMYEQFMYSNGFVFFDPFESKMLGKYHREWIAEHSDMIVSEKDYFLFSLLHEVGHAYTLDNLTEKEVEYETMCRTLLDWSDESPKEVNEAYFNLPAEKLATGWALGVMRDNPEWCAKQSRLLYEALRHFGNVNGWEI